MNELGHRVKGLHLLMVMLFAWDEDARASPGKTIPSKRGDSASMEGKGDACRRAKREILTSQSVDSVQQGAGTSVQLHLREESHSTS